MLNNWWYLQSGVEKKIDFQKLLGGNHILNIEVFAIRRRKRKPIFKSCGGEPHSEY